MISNGIRQRTLFPMKSGARVKIKRSWLESTWSPHRQEKVTKNIGVQTMTIRQIDRQISCHLIQSSSSDTSLSNDHSTSTVSSSTDSSTIDESDSDHPNWNNNNNSRDDHSKSNEQSWSGVNDKAQCCSEIKLSTRKNRVLETVFNRIPFLRFSSLKNGSTSRCRRSAARNFNQSISTEKQSKEDVLKGKSSKMNRRRKKHHSHSQWSSAKKTFVDGNQASSSPTLTPESTIIPRAKSTKRPNPIHLDVKTHNLISRLKHPLDDSIEHHQRNTINELKAFLQQQNTYSLSKLS